MRHMDSISSHEFTFIFVRTSEQVNLRGKLSSQTIAEKLNSVKNKCLEMRGIAKTSKTRSRLKRTAIQIGNLIEYGFHDRAIREARAKPNGIIAMTLKYGREEAKSRMLARKRTQIYVRRTRRRQHPR
jgi:hypothetical protein